MQLSTLINKIESNYGISLYNKNNPGIFEIQINEKFIVYLENLEQGEYFIIYSSLGEINQQKNSELLYMLLCANYLLQETEGATVAIDRKNDSITLSQTIHCSHLTYPLFLSQLEHFINVYSHLEQKISDVLQKNTTEKEQTQKMNLLKA